MTLEERKKCSIGILILLSENVESQKTLYRIEVSEVFKMLIESIENIIDLREMNVYHPYPNAYNVYTIENEKYSVYQIAEIVLQFEPSDCEDKLKIAKDKLEKTLNILTALKVIDRHIFAEFMEYFEGTLRGIYAFSEVSK